jgi:hypothetical protein
MRGIMRGFMRGITDLYEGDKFEPPHTPSPLCKGIPKDYEGDEPKKTRKHIMQRARQ